MTQGAARADERITFAAQRAQPFVVARQELPVLHGVKDEPGRTRKQHQQFQVVLVEYALGRMGLQYQRAQALFARGQRRRHREQTLLHAPIFRRAGAQNALPLIEAFPRNIRHHTARTVGGRNGHVVKRNLFVVVRERYATGRRTETRRHLPPKRVKKQRQRGLSAQFAGEIIQIDQV